MVKLTGPGLAKAASGQLGGALIFSSSKGRAYLKKLTKPKQPRTPGQVASRAMMAILSAEWHNILAAHQATWNDLADAAAISPFNAYQRENLTRWSNHLAPSTRYPADETGSFGAQGLPYFEPLVRTIRIYWQQTVIGNAWLTLISGARTDADPPKPSNLLAGVRVGLTGWYEYIHGPLEPGTYWYRKDIVTIYGKYTKGSAWYDVVLP